MKSLLIIFSQTTVSKLEAPMKLINLNYIWDFTGIDLSFTLAYLLPGNFNNKFNYV